MALAFRTGSTTSAGNASGGSLSVNKGTGVVDGDIMVVNLYLESDTNTWGTVPSGWTSVFRQANPGRFNIEMFVKRAASEGASWAWVPTTTGVWRVAVFAAYSGGTGTGTILDLANGSQGDLVNASSQTAPSITTTGPDRMLVFGYANWLAVNVTAMAGAASNLRISSGGDTIADALRASAGATGTSNPSAGPGTDDYAALHAALISDTSGAADPFPAGRVRPGLTSTVRRAA
jgi:hypothetical protein